MASVRSLKSRAAKLAEELGEDIDLSGFDREGLAELVEGLEQRLAARADTDPPVAPVAEVRPAAPAEVRPPEPPPAPSGVPTTARVADGCAITSRRGILGEGQEVFLKDFAGDEDTQRQAMQTLLASGKLVR